MIPIVGMHRSGTSALAGAMHKLGANLGEEGRWLNPGKDNPKGFFELAPVVDLNREILLTQGGTWSNPPALPQGWDSDPELDSYREQAQDLLNELSEDVVAKDPQLSLTYPLWSSVGRLHSAILCLRNPVSVAGSLNVRNGFTIDQGLFLWLRYNAAALRNCPEALVVEYEDLLEDPFTHLKRVAEYTKLPSSHQIIALAAETISQKLAHHEAERLPDTATGTICQRLYDLLRAKSSGDQLEDSDLETWLEVITELPWPGLGNREIARARREVADHSTTLQELEQANSELQARNDRLQQELDNALRLADSRSIRAVLKSMDSVEKA